MASGAALTRLPTNALSDFVGIRQNVERFGLRDQGRWDELRDLFHPDASIHVSWYSGPIDGFIEKSAQMATASASAVSKHTIGASRVTIAGSRAISDTDITLLIRTKLGPIEADVTSYLRFFDRFERRDDGVWRVLSRKGIYEKDRIDPVAPSLLFPLIYKLARFNRFPRAYRHLAAGLARNGRSLATPIVEAGTSEEAELWRDARLWLEAPQG